MDRIYIGLCRLLIELTLCILFGVDELLSYMLVFEIYFRLNLFSYHHSFPKHVPDTYLHSSNVVLLFMLVNFEANTYPTFRSAKHKYTKVNMHYEMHVLWTWGSLSKQYYSKLVHIGEFNTIKSGSNILPSICWCNCNFGMYSPMYLMSCTPMFIPRCVYNVIESCHAPMFWSGGSIM